MSTLDIALLNVSVSKFSPETFIKSLLELVLVPDNNPPIHFLEIIFMPSYHTSSTSSASHVLLELTNLPL